MAVLAKNQPANRKSGLGSPSVFAAQVAEWSEATSALVAPDPSA
jgi:hypothetical protein